jgi:hypothetical protein
MFDAETISPMSDRLGRTCHRVETGTPVPNAMHTPISLDIIEWIN